MHVVPANLSANNGMKIRNAPLAESRASRTKRNETNVQHPRSCPSFSTLVYEFDHSISKKTYISSLGKRFFFLYYIYPISILFKNCFILEIEEEFYPISIFFKNCFILEIEEEFWSKIANRINFYDWYFKVTRSIEDNEAHPCLLETQLRVYPPETRNQWKSFTRNNHEFIVSLSLSLVRSQLHNSMHPLLQAWRTCGTRNNPMRARVPMGTGNEMVVTVSQPLRRWTAGMHPMMLSVGDCSLGHGDDTGPTGDPP